RARRSRRPARLPAGCAREASEPAPPSARSAQRPPAQQPVRGQEPHAGSVDDRLQVLQVLLSLRWAGRPRRGGRGRRADSRAGPLAPAVALLQDLRALELLTRVSIDRVAGAAHGVPGGELELEQPEVRVVL